MEKACEVKKAKVDFRQDGESAPVLTMTLEGALSEIHKSPDKLRALMEMLELPEGTTATVTVEISTTIVR